MQVPAPGIEVAPRMGGSRALGGVQPIARLVPNFIASSGLFFLLCDDGLLYAFFRFCGELS